MMLLLKNDKFNNRIDGAFIKISTLVAENIFDECFEMVKSFYM